MRPAWRTRRSASCSPRRLRPAHARPTVRTCSTSLKSGGGGSGRCLVRPARILALGGDGGQEPGMPRTRPDSQRAPSPSHRRTPRPALRSRGRRSPSALRRARAGCARPALVEGARARHALVGGLRVEPRRRSRAGAGGDARPDGRTVRARARCSRAQVDGPEARRARGVEPSHRAASHRGEAGRGFAPVRRARSVNWTPLGPHEAARLPRVAGAAARRGAFCGRRAHARRSAPRRGAPLPHGHAGRARGPRHAGGGRRPRRHQSGGRRRRRVRLRPRSCESVRPTWQPPLRRRTAPDSVAAPPRARAGRLPDAPAGRTTVVLLHPCSDGGNARELASAERRPSRTSSTLPARSTSARGRCTRRASRTRAPRSSARCCESRQALRRRPAHPPRRRQLRHPLRLHDAPHPRRARRSHRPALPAAMRGPLARAAQRLRTTGGGDGGGTAFPSIRLYAASSTRHRSVARFFARPHIGLGSNDP